jgi:hypothetical protein
LGGPVMEQLPRIAAVPVHFCSCGVSRRRSGQIDGRGSFAG